MIDDLLYQVVLARLRARAEVVERACEAAVQSGEHGVMVDGERAWVDARVPYGELWDVTACGPDHPTLVTG